MTTLTISLLDRARSLAEKLDTLLNAPRGGNQTTRKLCGELADILAELVHESKYNPAIDPGVDSREPFEKDNGGPFAADEYHVCGLARQLTELIGEDGKPRQATPPSLPKQQAKQQQVRQRQLPPPLPHLRGGVDPVPVVEFSFIDLSDIPPNQKPKFVLVIGFPVKSSKQVLQQHYNSLYTVGQKQRDESFMPLANATVHELAIAASTVYGRKYTYSVGE